MTGLHVTEEREIGGDSMKVIRWLRVILWLFVLFPILSTPTIGAVIADTIKGAASIEDLSIRENSPYNTYDNGGASVLSIVNSSGTHQRTLVRLLGLADVVGVDTTADPDTAWTIDSLVFWPYVTAQQSDTILVYRVLRYWHEGGDVSLWAMGEACWAGAYYVCDTGWTAWKGGSNCTDPGNWNGCSNTYADDGLRNSSEGGGLDYITINDFGLSIPTTATIRALNAIYNGYSNITSGILQFQVSIFKGGPPTGNEWYQNMLTRSTDTTYTDTVTDLWNTTLPVDSVTGSAFGAYVYNLSDWVDKKYLYLDQLAFQVKYTMTEADTLWGTAGCSNTTTDRSAIAMDTVIIDATGRVEDQKIYINPPLANGWLSGDSASYGIILVGMGAAHLTQMSSSQADSLPMFIVYHTEPGVRRRQLLLEED